MSKSKHYTITKKITPPPPLVRSTIWHMMDDLHFSWDKTLSHNKTWNITVCEREAGKSVNSWMKIFNAYYYHNCPSIVLRRRTVDINSAYIDDIASVINKFLKPEHHIQLVYLKGDLSAGIADVHVGKAGENYSWQSMKSLPVLFRIIALSVPMNRIKSMMLKNVKYFFYDECIANVRGGEKYLSGDEFFLIKEIYTTYNRESSKPIKILCAGNPYSVYAPLFTGLGVDSSKLKPGAFIVGPDYVVNCFQTPDELKQIILKNNPMYQFDESYKRYAFGGEAINDANIRLHKTEPAGFKMKYVFKLGKDYISIHVNKKKIKKNNNGFRYWVCKHNSEWLMKVSKRRKIMAFNYADLMDGVIKWTYTDRENFSGIKEAMAKREITYNCVDASYMLEDIEAYL